MNANPYVGLRPFETEDSFLFWGREQLRDELVDRLSRSRFVAVIGQSGSGKSSLVRAGLIPALKAGYLDANDIGWDIATLRPSEDPFRSLAEALASTQWGQSFASDRANTVDHVRQAIAESDANLTYTFMGHQSAATPRLLIVIDQFEELFRFRQRRNTSRGGGARVTERFIDSILTAANGPAPIYIVTTMRTDFLGECAYFPRLTEAINRNIFLVPNMTADQLTEAIARPAELVGGSIAMPLVERLVMQASADQGDLPLPVIQHGLMRAWERFAPRGGPAEITLENFRQLGRTQQILPAHLDEIFASLTADDARLAEIMFKRLTRETEAGQLIRDPTPAQEIANLAGVDLDRVARLCDEFRGEGRYFLTPALPTPITPQTVLDISHETIIAHWQRLASWVRQEGNNIRELRDLARMVTDKRPPLAGEDLKRFLAWKQKVEPKQDWARRYNIALDPVLRFLDESRESDEKRKLKEAITQGDVATALHLVNAGIRLTMEDLNYWEFLPHYAALVGLGDIDSAHEGKEAIPAFPRTLEADVVKHAKSSITDMFSLKDEQIRREFFSETVIRNRSLRGLHVLHFAASAGQVSVLRELDRQGVDFSVVTEKNTTVFQAAAGRADIETLKWLGEKMGALKELINSKNHDGVSAIHWAAMDGNIEVIDWILDIDPEAARTPSDSGFPVAFAAISQSEETVARLYAAAPEVAAYICKNGTIGLHYAAGDARYAPFVGAMKLLELASAIGAVPDGAGRSSLEIALNASNNEFVQRLIERRPDLAEEKHSGGNTILRWMRENNHKKHLALYLDNVPLRADAADVDGWTHTMLAAFCGNWPVLDRLTEMPDVNLEQVAEDGKTSLFTILDDVDRSDVVTKLVTTGKVNPWADDAGASRGLLVRALGKHDWSFASAILDSFPDNPSHAAAMQLDGALIAAVTSGASSSFVSALLLRGADPLKADALGVGPLHQAARLNAKEIFLMLQGRLTKGMLPQDSWGRSPLDCAPDAHAEFFAEALHGAVPTFSASNVPFFSRSLLRDADWASENSSVTRKILESDYIDGNKLNAATTVFTTRSLPFYNAGRLLRIMDPSWENTELVLYFLVNGDATIRLDGTSPPIHQANKDFPIELNDTNVCDYLAFFCFFVRGEEGPFMLLESADASYVPTDSWDWREPDREGAMTLRVLFQAPRFFGGNATDGWRISALVYYSNAIFVSDFVVQSSGMLEMVDDLPVIQKLPWSVNLPIA